MITLGQALSFSFLAVLACLTYLLAHAFSPARPSPRPSDSAPHNLAKFMFLLFSAFSCCKNPFYPEGLPFQMLLLATHSLVACYSGQITVWSAALSLPLLLLKLYLLHKQNLQRLAIPLMIGISISLEFLALLQLGPNTALLPVWVLAAFATDQVGVRPFCFLILHFFLPKVLSESQLMWAQGYVQFCQEVNKVQPQQFKRDQTYEDLAIDLEEYKLQRVQLHPYRLQDQQFYQIKLSALEFVQSPPRKTVCVTQAKRKGSLKKQKFFTHDKPTRLLEVLDSEEEQVWGEEPDTKEQTQCPNRLQEALEKASKEEELILEEHEFKPRRKRRRRKEEEISKMGQVNKLVGKMEAYKPRRRQKENRVPN